MDRSKRIQYDIPEYHRDNAPRICFGWGQVNGSLTAQVQMDKIHDLGVAAIPFHAGVLEHQGGN